MGLATIFLLLPFGPPLEALPCLPCERELRLEGVESYPAASAGREGKEPPPDSSKETGAWFHYLKAKFDLDEELPAAALSSYEAALAAEPRDPYLRFEFAADLTALNLDERALEQAREVYRLEPGMAAAVRLIGKLYLERSENAGAVREAEKFLSLAVELEPGDVFSASALAQIHLMRKDYAMASKVMREAAERNPLNAAAHYFLGQTYEKQGEDEDAARCYRQALLVNPGQASARDALLSVLRRLRRDREVIDFLEEMVQANPESSSLAVQLGHEHYKRRAYTRAAKFFDAALEREPDNFFAGFYLAASLSELGRFEESDSLFARLESEQPDDLDIPYSRVLNLIAQARWEAARLALLALLERLQETPLPLAGGQGEGVARKRADLVRYQLARVQHALGHYADSLVTLAPLAADEARVSSPVAALAAEDWRSQGEIGAAIAFLRRVGRAQPDSAWAAARLAEMLLRAGEGVEAATVIRSVLAKGRVQDYLLVVDIYQRLLYYGKAADLAEEGLGRYRRHADLLFSKGASLERLGRHREAVAVFQELLEVDPDHAPALNYLGYMWADRNENLEEALALLERAAGLDPDNPSYIDSLGWVLFRLRRFEEALSELTRAGVLIPEDSTVQEHLGDVFFVCGDASRARERWRRALSLGADDEMSLRKKLDGLPRR